MSATLHHVKALPAQGQVVRSPARVLGTGQLVTACTLASFAVAAAWSNPDPGMTLGAGLLLHSMLELAAVAVAAMVIFLGLQSYAAEAPRGVVTIAGACLGFEIAWASHLLFHFSLPEPTHPVNAETLELSWVGARLLLAAGLWAVAWMPWTPHAFSRRRLYVLSAFSIVAIAMAALAWAAKGSEIDAPGLPRAARYLLVLLFASAATALVLARRAGRLGDIGPLIAAAIVLCVSAMALAVAPENPLVYLVLLPTYDIVAFGFLVAAVFRYCVQIPIDRLQAMQLELKESRDRFQSLVDLSSDWYWEQDEHYRFTDLSSAVMTSSGIDPAANFGKTRWELDYVDVLPEEWAQHQATLEARHPFAGLVLKRRNPDGAIHYVSISGRPFFDPHGRFRGYRGTARDITKLKQAEESARTTNQALRAIVDTAPVAIYKTDREGRVTLWNAAAERIFGWTEREVIGQPLPTVPSGAQAEFTEFLGQMLAGKPLYGAEVERCTKDGRIIGVALYGTALRDLAGNLEEIMVIAADVTERRKADLALRESEERFRSLTALSSDWYWEQDDRFRFTFISGGLPTGNGAISGEILGKTRWELPALNLSDEDWTRHRAQLEAHRPFHDFEIRRESAGGDSLWFVLSGTPVFDRECNFRGYRGIGRDITARKLAEQALRQSEARFRRLTGLASDWYWEQDEQFRFVDSSEHSGHDSAWAGMVIGKTRWELPFVGVSEADWDRHRATLAAHLPFCDLELARHGPDGGLQYVSISGEPIFDERGQFKGYWGVARSVTERKRAELALTASEELARTMLDALPVSLCLLDANGNIVRVNRAWRDYVARSGGNLGDVPLGINYADFFRNLGYDDYSRHMASGIEAVLAGRRTDFEIEYESRRHGERSWWLSRVTRFGRTPTQAIVSHDDITALKYAEQTLRFEKEVLEMVALGVTLEAVLDTLSVNAERIARGGKVAVLLYDPDGKRLLQVAAPTLAPDFVAAIAGAAIGPASSGGDSPAFADEQIVVADIAADALCTAPFRDLARRHRLAAYCSTPIRGATGRILGILAVYYGEPRVPVDTERILLDRVTHLAAVAIERARALATLSDRERELALIMDNVPAMIAYYDANRCCRIANRRFAKFYGFDPGELPGKSQREILGEPNHKVARAATDKVLSGKSVSYQRTHRRPDGSSREIDVTLVPDIGADDAVAGFYVLIQDVTERRRSEEQIRKLVTEQQTLLDNTVAGIAFVKDQTIVRGNHSLARMFGYEPVAMSGLPLRELHPSPGLFAKREEVIGRHVRERGAEMSDVQMKRKDGSLFWCQQSVTAIDRNDLAQGIVWVVEDITERKLAELEIRQLNAELEIRVTQRTQQLEAANKELEAFSYSVSHDLRAPLRSIEGFSRLLTERYSRQLDGVARDYLLRIQRNSLRMGDLIDDMLKLSRITRTEVRRAQINLSALAREILERLRDGQSQRAVEIRVEDDIAVEADPRLLGIALENLLGNAWKFTSKQQDARIEVGTCERDGDKAIFVRDNGAGFDMKYAHKLFGSFQRLHAHDEFEGSGIGLAIARRVMTLHGGRIWAEGQVGNGATFYFII